MFTTCVCALVAVPASGLTRQQQSDTIVRVAETPRHAAVGRLVPDLSIGAVDGPSEYVFSGVKDVLPMSDGAILVADGSSSPMVREYDADGRFVRTFGRRGEGPGEYRSPEGVAQLPDGRVLVLDGAGQRVNVYSRTGVAVDTWTLTQFTFRLGPGGALHVGPDGSIQVGATALRRAASGLDFSRRQLDVIVRLRGDGTVLDTIAQPDLPHPGNATVTKRQAVGTGISSASVTVPFGPAATR